MNNLKQQLFQLLVKKKMGTVYFLCFIVPPMFWLVHFTRLASLYTHTMPCPSGPLVLPSVPVASFSSNVWTD